MDNLKKELFKNTIAIFIIYFIYILLARYILAI